MILEYILLHSSRDPNKVGVQYLVFRQRSRPAFQAGRRSGEGSWVLGTGVSANVGNPSNQEHGNLLSLKNSFFLVITFVFRKLTSNQSINIWYFPRFVFLFKTGYWIIWINYVINICSLRVTWYSLNLRVVSPLVEVSQAEEVNDLHHWQDFYQE